MVTSYDILPPEVQLSCDDKLLAIKTPNYIYNLPAQRRELPAKGGRTLRMSRYNKLPAFPVPLANDGQPIPAVPLTRVDIDATVSFFGQYIALNQTVVLQNQDSVLNSAIQLLGLSLRETEDLLTKDMLMAAATAITARGGNNGDDPTNVSIADLDLATSFLLSNDAWMLTDGIGADVGIGSAPVRQAYMAMCHTDLTPRLNGLTNFNSKWNYPNQQDTGYSEWGALNNIRFFVSSAGAVRPLASTQGANVYPITLTGLEAYGVVQQDNFSAHTIYRPGIYSDPLGQNATLGITFAQVPTILNDEWIVNLLTTF